MTETFLDGKVVLHAGDCVEVMRSLPEASVDAIVCDPPYGLEFMGKAWDSFTGAGMTKPGIGERDTEWPSFTGTNRTRCRNCGHLVGQGGSACKCASPKPYNAALPRSVGFGDWCFTWAAEAFRVLKPGGHLVAFSGTRTYHRMACAIEDAGFEIRDQIGWAYGCLDEATLAVTPRGNVPHSALNPGDLVLTYDVGSKSYQWGAVEHVHRYRISDTVYRISTDHGEQVVSRNHRCIVERDGADTFALAEAVARQRAARVPVLEDLPALLEALRGYDEGAGHSQSDVLDGVQERADRRCGDRASIAIQPSRYGCVRGLREREGNTLVGAAQGATARVLKAVQRRASWRRVEGARAQRPRGMDAGVRGGARRALHRAVQSIMEGWRHVSAEARQLCERALCPLPAGVLGYGAAGWLRDGASSGRGAHPRALPHAGGVGAPHRPQAAQQLPDEPHAVRDEQRSQTVRAWAGHKTVVGRITPEPYDGVIWCVTVSTGAFVAVRDGMAFPTGNSGFPKSLDVSKAIDKAAGVDREDKFEGAFARRAGPTGNKKCDVCGKWLVSGSPCQCPRPQDEPMTEAARAWKGFGTALKPAWEPICLARKPLIGTVVQNVLKHGTGALNVDGCRVETDENPSGARRASASPIREAGSWANDRRSPETYAAVRPGEALGRFPANLVLGWPADEYELRADATIEQKRELYRWLSENT